MKKHFKKTIRNYAENRFQKTASSINKIYRGIRLYRSNSSFQAWRFLFRHFYIRMFNGGAPDLLTIGLTYRCQCSCVHCSSNVPNRKKSEELETSQVKSIIDQAKSLGIVRTTFFGGEPLLRKDIVELVQYAHDAGMITRINTNGWLLSRELVSKLEDAGLTLCDVSIDDPDSKTHDKLRGLPGLHQKAVEGIRILKDYKILCQIVTYASKRNITSGLKQMIELGKKLGVFAVSIVFPMATGCWYNSLDVLLSENEKERVRKLGDFHFVHIELPTQQSKCNVYKKSSLYVSSEGNITPCPFIPFPLGNIKKHNLDEIWHKFSSGINLNFSGDCPMNDNKYREILKSRIESIGKELG